MTAHHRIYWFRLCCAWLALAGAVELFFLGLTNAAADRIVIAAGSGTYRILHVHLLVMGFLFSLILLMLETRFRLSGQRGARVFSVLYPAALLVTVALQFYKSICQLFGYQILAAVTHGGATAAHTALGVALILFLVMVYRATADARSQSGDGGA